MGSSKKTVEDLEGGFERETGLGYDPVTRKIEASDEWWTRKFEVNSLYIIVKNSTIYNYIVF